VGPGGRAPLLGTPKDMLNKVPEWASISIGATLLLGLSDKEILYIKRDVKMPCKWVSLSIGAGLGNLERIRLWGLFERKVKYIWVPFLTQRTFRF